MELYPDFKELLALFNARNVEYVIAGGYALAFHGAPRYTGDLDILVRSDPQNAQRVVEPLGALGFASVDIAVEDFASPEKVLQLGFPPVRVDIITSLTGVLWDEVYAGRVAGNYGDVPVHFIGRKEFVANKRATGRPQDLADLRALGESL